MDGLVIFAKANLNGTTSGVLPSGKGGVEGYTIVLIETCIRPKGKISAVESLRRPPNS
jgi:hypothetical protein